jgi:hypothetical protein
MLTSYLSENVKGRDHSEYIGVGGRIILKGILGKYVEKVWTGLSWLIIGTSCGLL